MDKLSNLQKSILRELVTGISERKHTTPSERAVWSRAMRRLEQRGLVKREARGKFQLTVEGKEIADSIIAEAQFLADVLERERRGEIPAFIQELKQAPAAAKAQKNVFIRTFRNRIRKQRQKRHPLPLFAFYLSRLKPS